MKRIAVSTVLLLAASFALAGGLSKKYKNWAQASILPTDAPKPSPEPQQ